MKLAEALKTMAQRTKITYQNWGKKVGNVTDGVVTSAIDRNDCMTSTLVRLANAAGYDVLLVRRHALEYEEPIVIDCTGKNRTGDSSNGCVGVAETRDNRKEGD